MKSQNQELVYKADGSPVHVGDHVTTNRHERAETLIVTGGQPPRHAASSGRVYVRHENGAEREYFPHCFDMEWQQVS